MADNTMQNASTISTTAGSIGLSAGLGAATTAAAGASTGAAAAGLAAFGPIGWVGLGLMAVGMAMGWIGSNDAADEAEKIADENASLIEANAKQQEWLNHIGEQRFSEQQSVALGDIKAGVAKQNMTGTAGGEAYESNADTTAEMDTFLLKYKNNADIKNMLDQARIVRQGGQASADALRTNANANAVNNLGSLGIKSAALFGETKTTTTGTSSDSDLKSRLAINYNGWKK